MNLLKQYVDAFNQADDECYYNQIDNAHALAWMKETIPILECPDKELERIYYFRWWTYRKHLKKTENGHVITEFLPKVPWSGRHNTINAAVGFHIAEGRWLAGGQRYMEDYIQFWLDGKGKACGYSTWLIHAIYEYCELKDDFSIAVENLDKMIAYLRHWEKEHMGKSGLFWSIDDDDAMEYTISGTRTDGSPEKGYRPTLNSYMAADARALARIAELAGRKEIAEEFYQRYERLKTLINTQLWDGDFYKVRGIDDATGEPVVYETGHPQDVRELIGYIPWMFQIPPEGREDAFRCLKSPQSFWTEHGFTTAEQTHPRFLFKVGHECLWNGYIWPFATSQTLRAVNSLLRHYRQTAITKEDFYQMLHIYAKSHYRQLENGKAVPWIDEVMHPGTGDWSAREILKNLGWKKELGGYERGKDYNHSAFCDLVLGGLLGISMENGAPCVQPLVPEEWEYFRVSNLELGGRKYEISFQREADGQPHIDLIQC